LGLGLGVRGLDAGLQRTLRRGQLGGLLLNGGVRRRQLRAELGVAQHVRGLAGLVLR
jgi:hypothetical protein